MYMMQRPTRNARRVVRDLISRGLLPKGSKREAALEFDRALRQAQRRFLSTLAAASYATAVAETATN